MDQPTEQMGRESTTTVDKEKFDQARRDLRVALDMPLLTRDPFSTAAYGRTVGKQDIPNAAREIALKAVADALDSL